MSKTSGRIIDEIIQPMRDVQIDDTEFSCLKAVVFFDPGTIEVTFIWMADGLCSSFKYLQLNYVVLSKWLISYFISA